MIAIEIVRHRLALAVRLDDHFTMEPYAGELLVELDSQEPSVRTVDRAGARHDDGTYRFVEPVKVGMRQVKVTGDRAFTWAATTAVAIPQADPAIPVVIEVWPAPNAKVPASTLAIRGRLQAAPPAGPVAIGQEVRIDVVGVAARNRRTRCDANGEFLFVVLGVMELTADYEVPLRITIPGRTVASIDIVDGNVTTNVPNGPPVVAPFSFSVRPGRETRALIHLT